MIMIYPLFAAKEIPQDKTAFFSSLMESRQPRLKCNQKASAAVCPLQARRALGGIDPIEMPACHRPLFVFGCRSPFGNSLATVVDSSL
jgi:hypothetical protein